MCVAYWSGGARKAVTMGRIYAAGIKYLMNEGSDLNIPAVIS